MNKKTEEKPAKFEAPEPKDTTEIDAATAEIDEADLNPLSEEDEAALNEELSNEPPVVNAGQQLPAFTCKDLRDKLSQPIPERLLKKMTGRGGSKPLTYIHWLTVKKFLDFRTPQWQYRVTHIDTTELGVAVAVEISIQCADGVIVGSGVGFKEHRTGRDQKPTGFGGAPVVAERQAFKRAAAMLGLGANLYEG